MKTENEELKFRNANPNINDEVFNSLKNQANGSGKSLEEAMKDPVFKSYLETQNANERVSSTQANPSTRISPSGNNSYSDMSSEDFNTARDRIMSSR